MSDPYPPQPGGPYVQPQPQPQAPQQPYGAYPPPQPGYPPYPGYGYPPYPVQAPMSGLAIASFVLSLVWLWGVGSVVALVLGLVALRQIKRTGQRGRGFAIAGVAIAGATIVLLVLAVALFLGAHGLNGGTTVEVPGITT
ncbi:hypothetical protein GCM10023221_11830 [Luteimicrobium xylanilyticum]|uniref:DUF4190 domain-containing protein n=1 Tax=Luteimicrobium xylanilyticum TaxID=1133546 RepID=A0A5P9QD09_9MICO|nr:DUF4190 domain-containing protein [Luteimicrobium xylanilyticum]QFU99341.1 hypothetical protein KDY119_02869 [Luteimicrobium xylanilyticum]